MDFILDHLYDDALFLIGAGLRLPALCDIVHAIELGDPDDYTTLAAGITYKFFWEVSE